MNLPSHHDLYFAPRFVSALDAVPELISILPDVKTTNDFIKKPVALDEFISAVRTAIAR
ncbi:MAG: hypothetical protein WBF33_38115 [Candidatus Nitrosopolaris sp.]